MTHAKKRKKNFHVLQRWLFSFDGCSLEILHKHKKKANENLPTFFVLKKPRSGSVFTKKPGAGSGSRFNENRSTAMVSRQVIFSLGS
jgi:hypothetical protein